MAEGGTNIEINGANISPEEAVDFLKKGTASEGIQSKDHRSGIVNKVKSFFNRNKKMEDPELAQAVDYLQKKEGAVLPEKFKVIEGETSSQNQSQPQKTEAA